MKDVLDYQLTSPGVDRVVKWALVVACLSFALQCVYREDWLMTAILAGTASGGIKELLPRRATL